MFEKKLYRSQKNKMLAGICGGLGEYFNIDATLLRLFWLLIVVFTGVFPGVIVYLLAIVVIPLSPGATINHEEKEQPNTTQHHPNQ